MRILAGMLHGSGRAGQLGRRVLDVIHEFERENEPEPNTEAYAIFMEEFFNETGEEMRRDAAVKVEKQQTVVVGPVPA